MNSRFSSALVDAALSAALVWVTTLAAQAAPPATAVATNSPAPLLRVIPQSLFLIPTNSADGRNPFFPQSSPLGSTAPVKKTSDNLVLIMNGIGGDPAHRLAIINSKDFSEGEEREISHVKIRCVEIRTNSVVIEVNGERKELRLRGEN